MRVYLKRQTVKYIGKRPIELDSPVYSLATWKDVNDADIVQLDVTGDDLNYAYKYSDNEQEYFSMLINAVDRRHEKEKVEELHDKLCKRLNHSWA